MADRSNIEWTDSTFNPWVGCTKISPGCDHCYAESWAKRSGDVKWGQPGERGERRRTKTWGNPAKWERQHEQFFADRGRRRRVFCASLADVFDNQVPWHWRPLLWQPIRETPHLDWIILTKRPQNIKAMLPDDWGDGYSHVWLITTVCNQEEADRNIPILLDVPARIHGISVEPMLGPIDLTRYLPCTTPRACDKRIGHGCGQCAWDTGTNDNALKWVICGGESGGGARDMPDHGAENLLNQCAASGTAFFMKQMTKKAPIPDHLMVREFPA